jgi:hypothetical protein
MNTTTKHSEVTMSNNKQSSVDYLIEQLLPKALSAEQFYHIQQAKAMHKDEIEDAELRGKEIIIIKHTEFGGNK